MRHPPRQRPAVTGDSRPRPRRHTVCVVVHSRQGRRVYIPLSSGLLDARPVAPATSPPTGHALLAPVDWLRRQLPCPLPVLTVLGRPAVSTTGQPPDDTTSQHCLLTRSRLTVRRHLSPQSGRTGRDLQSGEPVGYCHRFVSRVLALADRATRRGDGKIQIRRRRYVVMTRKNVGGRDRIARAALAVVLTVVAVSTLRAGRRKAGLLALVGALGIGFNATTGFCGLNRTLGIDTTEE